MTGYKYDAEEARRVAHKIAWTPGWQYLTVWRFEQADENHDGLLFPADGADSWTLNVERGDGGQEVKAPSWCDDGSIVQHLVYWRREVRGLVPSMNLAHVHEQHKS